MKHWGVYLIFTAIVFGESFSQSVHDDYCKEFQKERSATCFDKSTLGFCMLVADEWRAIEAATCDSRLCCDAKAMGCTMKSDCNDESTTISTSITTASSVETTSNATCIVGDLKKHESDCKRFYYCSQHAWVESVCSAGVYDESRKSCAFGTCNT